MEQQLTPEQEQAQQQLMNRLAQTSVLEKKVEILEGDNSNLRTQLAQMLVARENDAQYIEQLQTQVFEAQNESEDNTEEQEESAKK